jgi:hypothetical protein
MARTVLTPVGTLARDGSLNLTAGVTPDATNGNIVPGPVGPFHLSILVLNSDSSNHSLYVRASGYAGSATGGANSGYTLAQYQPLAQASVGDLTITCAHTTGGYTVVESLTSDRYAQIDGSVWLDWSASTSMTVFAWYRPYLP